MVKYQTDALDRTFAALADPTRRAMLARLARKDDLSISDLAAPFDMSLPAVMKHLDVLTDAGLVARTKTGRVVSCRFKADAIERASEWLNRYTKFWTDRLDSLAAFLEEEACPPSQRNQVSPSSGASTRRPRKSSPRGATPKR
jgi:DNA-binding transcriptional ArsR family regulator